MRYWMGFVLALAIATTPHGALGQETGAEPGLPLPGYAPLPPTGYTKDSVSLRYSQGRSGIRQLDSRLRTMRVGVAMTTILACGGVAMLGAGVALRGKARMRMSSTSPGSALRSRERSFSSAAPLASASSAGSFEAPSRSGENELRGRCPLIYWKAKAPARSRCSLRRYPGRGKNCV